MVISENKLGELLRQKRHEKGLIMKHVAERLGVHHSLISTYEIGKRNPSLKTLKQLSEFYEIPYQELLDLRLDKKGVLKKEMSMKRNITKLKKALKEIDTISTQREVRRIVANVLFDVDR